MINFEPEIDCFALKDGQCSCLKELYCKNGHCSFYTSKQNIDTNSIEEDILRYAITEKMLKRKDYKDLLNIVKFKIELYEGFINDENTEFNFDKNELMRMKELCLKIEKILEGS